MTNYKVLEDNGGGLYIFTFDKNGNVVRGFCNLEYLSHDDFMDCINALNEGDSGHDWDGQFLNPWSIYESLTSNLPFGCEIVAENNELYPEKMGKAAKIAYGLED